MSDTTPAPTTDAAAPAPTANPMIANATQALAIKELTETVSGVKKSIKKLWIAVIIVGVLGVGLGGYSVAQRFIGFGMGTRPNWQRGTTTGSTTGATTGGTTTGGTQDAGAPTQP